MERKLHDPDATASQPSGCIPRLFGEHREHLPPAGAQWKGEAKELVMRPTKSRSVNDRED
jgi:hypothetical protein